MIAVLYLKCSEFIGQTIEDFLCCRIGAVIILINFLDVWLDHHLSAVFFCVKFRGLSFGYRLLFEINLDVSQQISIKILNFDNKSYKTTTIHRNNIVPSSPIQPFRKPPILLRISQTFIPHVNINAFQSLLSEFHGISFKGQIN